MLEQFAFHTHQVRVVVIDDAPWFVAGDVCAALGLSNVGNVLARLDADEQSSIRLTDGTPGNPNRAIVSEPGLYAIVLRSDRPEAREFRRWVTREVLPAIRQTGAYSARPAPEPAYALPQTYAEALRELATTVEERDEARAAARELAPAAGAWRDLASADGPDVTVSDAAKILARAGASTGPNKLYALLAEMQWVFRRGGQWHAMQRHVTAGRVTQRLAPYTHPHTGDTCVRAQVRITPKGLGDLRARLGVPDELTFDPSCEAPAPLTAPALPPAAHHREG